jgi:ectoine hydroxylase-related dioxygenase (phytanoyl-CoA dioxygenase family)
LISVPITEEEVESRKITPEHVRAAAQAIDTDGFVVLENVVSRDHLGVLREKMLEDVQLLLNRENAPFNWNTGNVQQNPPPFPPYLFRDVLLNDMVVAVTQAVLGPGLRNSYYSGNTAMPSEDRQPVHADTGHLWMNLKVAHPAAQLVVNVPTVAVSAANGSTEIWPGTHREIAVSIHDDIKIPEETLARRREVAPPIQPTIPLGGVLIRDIRLWHAGMPNRTDHPRPMIAMIHSCGWLRTGKLEFPKGTEEFFEGSDLGTDAVFVDGTIDHIRKPHAYEYQK